jgi:hypothetical protein
MVTNAALFTAWETGKLPADHAELLNAARLKPGDIATPEGKGVLWDAHARTAVSDIYNTGQFATPLIELPIDKITPAEQQEFMQFRAEYLNLWRQFFDPVGMRFAIGDKQVKLDTYILPLLNSSQYAWLRGSRGAGPAAFDPTTISAKSLLHVAIDTGIVGADDWIGDLAIVRLDDDPAIRKLVDFWIHRQLEPSGGRDWEEILESVRLALQLPLTAGVSIKNRHKFDIFLTAMQRELRSSIPSTATPITPAYKGVPITRVVFSPGGPAEQFLRIKQLPNLYHAVINDWFYVSLREAPLKELIDRSEARRAGQANSASVPINFSVYAAPRPAREAGPALDYFLEWETHRRALVNCPAWAVLYRCGMVTDETAQKNKETTALRFLGFVPVSPDGERYSFDVRTSDVVNSRHGSLRRPRLHAGIADASPLARLLEQFRSLRADLRFREDGVHTTVTVERKRR